MSLFTLLLLLPLAAAGGDGGFSTHARAAGDGRYIAWREHRIDDEGLSGVPLRGADGLAVVDLDGDGHADVVSVHEDSSHLRLAFGTADPDRWERATLAAGELVGGCEDVAAGDLDGDGRPDLVVAAEVGRLVFFPAPEKVRDPAAWKGVVLPGTEGRGSWIRVALADVDGDGRPDVVATNKNRPGAQGTYSWFSFAGGPGAPGAWREHVIGRAVFPINARPVDVDGDGDMDVVGASWGEEALYFFENLGPEDPGAAGAPKEGSEDGGEAAGRPMEGTGDGAVRWARHTLHAGRDPLTIGFMMELADLNGDGRMDLVAATGPRWQGHDEIHWFEQPEDPRQRWRPHLLGSLHPDRATGLELVDVDGDGRLDLFVGAYSWEPWEYEPENPSPDDSCGRLAWFEAPREVATPWHRHDISRRRRGMFDLFEVRDMDGDALPDLLTTRGNSGGYDGVIWLQQVRSPSPGPAFFQARAQDSPEIPLPAGAPAAAGDPPPSGRR